MTVIQRLAQIARPFRTVLISGIVMMFLSIFLESVIFSGLMANLISLVGGDTGLIRQRDTSVLDTSPLVSFFKHSWSHIHHFLTDHIPHFVNTADKPKYLIFLCVITVIVMFMKAIVH